MTERSYILTVALNKLRRMISHALTIVINEINKHLIENYGLSTNSPQVGLGNLAEGIGTGEGMVQRGIINLSMVNIKEEKSLKNLPNYFRNEATLTVSYENQPVYLNFYIMFTATHSDYTSALLSLSRVILFFQYKNVFTQDNVSQSSIDDRAPSNPLDRLESFKLNFELYSPSMEEINHLWGTLGGKQYPFILYLMRMVDLRFRAVQSSGSLITDIRNDFSLKNSQGT